MINKQINYKNTKKFAFGVAAVSLLICRFAYSKEVSAQSRIPLVVAPARQTVAIDAGKTENLQIKFFNESITPVSGNIKAVDFIVTGSDGSPILLEDQINDWVKLPYDRASIASGDVLRVNFKVTVPKDTQPGGRYVAIIFEQTGQLSQTSETESVSAVSPRIVGLLSIRVNGSIIESAFVDVFKTPKFMEFGKIPVDFEILNKGGYHINPKGQITLTNWMGKEIERVTIDDKNIFPNVSRIYDAKLGQTWMFGRYSVGLTASYGEQGKTLLANSFVWVVPITVVVIIIFSILILILAVYLISRKVKAKQEVLEEKLEEEISDLEAIKNKFKDKIPKL
ncbi:MAG: hypothetical protein Q8O68_01320 [Candidatus Daviesbacteria bacterium]|nr:hypothetical protein [Candidatus Daviesbacteria bacterium]